MRINPPATMVRRPRKRKIALHGAMENFEVVLPWANP
jgi:hypothetical protein